MGARGGVVDSRLVPPRPARPRSRPAPKAPPARGTERLPVKLDSPPACGRSSARVLAFVLAALLLAGCSGISAPTPLIAESDPTATPTPSPAPATLLTPEPERCAGGRLRVGDLAIVGEEWAAGVQSAIEASRAWRPDARLVTMKVGCAPLEAGFRWQGTFYSQTAQSFFFSDTGLSEPAEVDPASVPALPLEEVDFRRLHLALARAGYGEEDELNPATGATVRLNAPTDPFGPPGTPQGLVYHVAVAEQGNVQDLFVSSPGWTIHSYQDRD
jgi:hypothetical protein